MNPCPGDHADPGLRVSESPGLAVASEGDRDAQAEHIDRNWDERTRKEIEIGAHMRESNRADYRAAKMSWPDRLNDGR